jgi:oligopeptide/dipeptide ABC transporter ATP-binding protein
MTAEWSLRGTALSMHYPVGPRVLRAVEDVSLEVTRGHTLALVGESGCGKSTLARLLLGLLKPTSGRACLGEVDLAQAGPAQWRALRRHLGLVGQDPAAALNPLRTIRQALEEPFAIHGESGGWQARVQALASRVGLSEEHLGRLPGNLSGGQRQRVVIARALALEPAFLVADEPVASLDVSVRAQVLNLLVELQRERNLGCLLVSHDLQVVRHLADAVAVMYLGRIVEQAPAHRFFQGPRHPYASVLLASMPGSHRPRLLLEGEPPSPLDQPQGCPFHPRCPVFRGLSPQERQRCLGERPELREVEAAGGTVACHFPVISARCR